ncbi:hypothetical protein OPU71_15285 [Niveibacterium sp. 24ML]|uniref:hypothetical protein n=1 Tax=Niveibacterium sp. 24ML TaxID=2985512 RepID=UPI00226D962E|nr:hypothetical protein [Niveibacterium sp. 24ML]MCX9157491.1 hypothetical protein [Niveibacterium sp. 24ML]
MPILGIGFHLIVALFFGIHAIRRGQNLYWLMILFAFPLLGSIAYFFAIYLPEARHSRGARAAGKLVVKTIDPGRALRIAREAFERTPTVDNRLQFARALLDAGDVRAAREHYEQAAQGPFAEDLAVVQGLVCAQLATDDGVAALRVLDAFFAAQPERRAHPDLSLAFARACALASPDRAADAFERALRVANGPETKCRYADWLVSQGEIGRASALYREVVTDAAHWHSHARSINRDWLRRAQSALAQTQA